MKIPRTKKRRSRRSRRTSISRNGGVYEEVLGLTHGTSLSFFSEILENRFIRANEGNAPKNVFGEMVRLNQGAFFSLVLKCNEGSSLQPLCANDLIMVFSKDILQQPYHISNAWCGGMQYAPLRPGKIARIPWVRSYGNVEEYITDNASKICNGHVNNEVVFHHDIPIEYLTEIWICNTPKMFQRINQKQSNGSFTRKIMEQHFNPTKVFQHVSELLALNGFNIPVKMVRDIPHLG